MFSLNDCLYDKEKSMMPHDIIWVEMGATPVETEALFLPLTSIQQIGISLKKVLKT